MKRRYCDYMNEIQPSAGFTARLEKEMIRELRRKEKNSASRILAATAACAAVTLLSVIGMRTLKPQTDVIARPDGPGIINSNQPLSASITTAPTAAPTLQPPTAPTAVPTEQPSAVYPPDDVRLELEMSDEGVFLSPDVASVDFNLFHDHLAGSSTHGSHLVEIHQGPELNSVVIAPLRPGTAYWPMTGEENMAMLTNDKGKEVGYAQRVRYLDENTNTVKEGWKHTFTSAETPPPEVPDNPVEEIQLPGKVTAQHARLLYGRSANAPEVAILEKDQLIAIGHRVGNWLYVSTKPFCFAGDTPAVGWLHITEAVTASWRTNFAQVDLLADKVNLRASPDGKVIRSIDKDSHIFYGGATVPGKDGDWHYVTVDWFMDGARNGYISADYAKLNLVRLGDELSFDGVISATLSYAENAPLGPAAQTVEGEKLTLLIDRLKNAVSESVYTEVCGEGAATLTLTYSDGNTIALPISSDSCTKVRHGPVTYDLKTDAERTERFLNDGGVSLEDILSPIFDEIFTGNPQTDLVMSSESAWNNTIALGVAKQMLGLSGGKYPLEVRSEPAVDAPVTAVLQPGTAHWPTHANQVRLSDTSYCEEIKWWDSEGKQMRTGWLLEECGTGGTKETPESTLEVINLPGRFITDNTPLRYGPTEEAPVVTTMSTGQKLFLCARDGDWIFISYGDWPAPDFCGWVHVSEVEALQLRESFSRIDLLAEEVEIFSDPDGNAATVMTREKAQSGFISYMGTTLTTESGKWHYVGYREQYEDDTTYGFVRADQTQIYTFALADELSLNGAASAVLVRTILEPYGEEKQTIEGDKLSALMNILSGAYSKEVYRPFGNESVLTLRLTFDDNREETLFLHNDGEPYLRFGDVTYDLRSEAQRSGDFVSGDKTGLSDILSPIFDQIKFP